MSGRSDFFATYCTHIFTELQWIGYEDEDSLKIKMRSEDFGSPVHPVSFLKVASILYLVNISIWGARQINLHSHIFGVNTLSDLSAMQGCVSSRPHASPSGDDANAKTVVVEKIHVV